MILVISASVERFKIVKLILRLAVIFVDSPQTVIV